MSAVFDSDILVDVLRGEPSAQRVLHRFDKKPVCCAAITVAELWAGVRPQDEQAVENLLNGFRIIPVDAIVARRAGDYLRAFSRSRGVLLPDALIAATAWVAKIPLLTRNTKHFPMDDIQIVKPY